MYNRQAATAHGGSFLHPRCVVLFYSCNLYYSSTVYLHTRDRTNDKTSLTPFCRDSTPYFVRTIYGGRSNISIQSDEVTTGRKISIKINLLIDDYDNNNNIEHFGISIVFGGRSSATYK